MHVLTSEEPSSLYVKVKGFSSQWKHAEYSEFFIGNETEGFKLSIGGYSGDAGKSIRIITTFIIFATLRKYFELSFQRYSYIESHIENYLYTLNDLFATTSTNTGIINLHEMYSFIDSHT